MIKVSKYNLIYNKDNYSFFEEKDDGNIEYKWRLDYKNDMSLKKLVSQLLWRLNEGKENYGVYEAHYLLGVYDSGKIGNLTKDELNITIHIFKTILHKANAKIILEEFHEISSSNIYYCIIRLKEYEKKINEINVMVCGTEQVGKTTLISYLCNSIPDNGDGLIREIIMYHEHEKISGNTTSIKKQILGVKDSKLINYDYSNNWEEITKVSDKIVNIYDTPGNKKYLKNILNAICTYSIDIIFFLEDEEKDFSTQLEYFYLIESYCNFANIDLYTIISKRESKNYNNSEINISCIKPELSDMNRLQQILINFNKTKIKQLDKLNLDVIFRITNVFNIPDCDNIIEGVQISGDLKLDNYYLIYPDLTYKPIKIKTIFRKKIASKQLHKNETGSLTFIDNFDKNIIKNCIIVNNIDFSKFNIKENIIELNIIKKGIIHNINKTNYFLINGNLCYNVNILNILNQTDNKISIQLLGKIYFQDKLFFLLPADFKCFSEVFLLEI